MNRWLGIATEGWPVILALGALAGALAYSPWPFAALPALLSVVLAIIKFHDAEIEVHADPNGVLSPVSGKVTAISRHAEEIRILIRVKWFGPYSLRAPVEGTVRESQRKRRGHGMLLRTDEGEDVYLRLFGPEWFAPVSHLEYGARIGQAQRCGMLRLASAAEVVLPPDASIAVAKGERVSAGRTLLATIRPAPGETVPDASA